jgi:hypothetical protein
MDGTQIAPYRVLAGSDRDAVILDLLRRIDARQLSVTTAGKSRWDAGWGENLDALRATGDLASLRPKYIRAGQPLRMHGEFVVAEDPDYEAHWYDAFRADICRHFEPYAAIYEFGCGSGHNLAYLAQRFPDKRIVGLDWSSPAVDIANTLRDKHGLNVAGRSFDFFAPDRNMLIPEGSAVLTVGALEQTSTKWVQFFEWLVDRKPAFCLHVEPLVHLYDPGNLVDYTAIRAHQVRQFWTGIDEAIGDYAKWHRMTRTGFGSLALEGYSQLSWVPK